MITKYQQTFERVSSPKTSDFGRHAIYHFERYCKGCGAGLTMPKTSQGKYAYHVYVRGYCCEDCVGKKFRRGGRVREVYSVANDVRPVEKLAFMGLEIERWMQKLNHINKLVVVAEKNLSLLSEKLSFLESQTGESWSVGRFYYKLNKIL